MKKITLLVLIVLTVVACKSKYPDLNDGVYAEFITNKGTFVAKLYNEATPLTVANFASLAEGTNGMVDSIYKGKKFYNGLTFHRVIKDFMIQGGDPQGNGQGNPGYRFPDEIVDSLQFDSKGILAMANSGPATNGSQFFITLKATPWLDGRHTIFGEIVKGQEIVDSIGNVETIKPGDKPKDSIFMKEVNIINKGKSKVSHFTEQMEKIEKRKKEKEERIAKVAKKKALGFDKLREEAEELPSGIKIYYNEKGEGKQPKEGAKVLMSYAGYFDDGRLFDSNRLEVAEQYENVDEARKAAQQYKPVETQYSSEARLIPGFREGLMQLSVGDKATVFIPSHLGYGQRGYPPLIPGNADLIFELELVDIVE
ncbi:peptidylprolyl isomerase [Marixanthomonas sp. SCSIO 43207]|uniref:peptidylprolyl isomerase n=1 Tax=Marixanthomonas sp. SCSIO 43207 TaxID=2779360 RepID=UPI001CA86B0A|nr:peptidylprolyl isomerase [Marixanthomonas sp. SCSIO 43207]UAB81127.1 peptidylprolyl isomerase [Marixanthomonas sp. SCSIO 43207]